MHTRMRAIVQTAATGVKGVSLHGDIAIVSDEVSGVLLIDVSDPTSPSLLGTYAGTGVANSVTAAPPC